MIALAKKRDWEQLSPEEKSDPFLCRVLCIKAMYGRYPFADCWVQRTEHTAAPTAYLSKTDGVVTLFARACADFEELCIFLNMTGARCVMCSAFHAQQLRITPVETGAVLKWQGCLTKPPVPATSPNLHRAYQVLQACKSKRFRVPAFEPFYLDMSHKLRHGGASLAGYEKNGVLAACAMTVAETADAAVIGAVAVLPAYQKQGLGSQVVQSLLHSCVQKGQKHIYVYCNSKETVLFYRKMGFAHSGRWAETGPV